MTPYTIPPRKRLVRYQKITTTNSLSLGMLRVLTTWEALAIREMVEEEDRLILAELQEIIDE